MVTYLPQTGPRSPTESAGATGRSPRTGGCEPGAVSPVATRAAVAARKAFLPRVRDPCPERPPADRDPAFAHYHSGWLLSRLRPAARPGRPARARLRQ